AREADVWPDPVVGVIAIGYECIETIVTAAELNDDEDTAIGKSLDGGGGAMGGTGEETRRHTDGGKHGSALEELAPAYLYVHVTFPFARCVGAAMANSAGIRPCSIADAMRRSWIRGSSFRVSMVHQGM